MILSDTAILNEISLGNIHLEPFTAGLLQPASIDVRFNEFARDSNAVTPHPSGNGWWLRPQRMVLGSLIERIKLPTTLVGVLDGKSTWARRGLLIHFTAGYIDPGFDGEITLEMLNVSTKVLHITTGTAIGQLRFHRVEGSVARPYGSEGLGSHYQGQVGPTPAFGDTDRWWMR